ncbi:IS66 family transposase ISMma15 [subsurface metagenome]
MGGKGKDPKKLTKGQIFALYKAGPEAIYSLIEYLQESNRQLHERLQEIERQLKMNSRNSSKPPSSDGMKKFPKVRKPTGRKPGGQKGHEGKTLRMVDNPDKVKFYKVECCGNCLNSLKDKQATEYDRRQVFDIPPIKAEVTEHRAEIKECDRCGAVTVAEFPEDVTHKVQYGPWLKANAVYIKNYALLSYDRAAELFEDLFGVPLSAGTLVNIDRETGKRLEEVNERIKEQMISSAIVHFDETGMRISGKLNWLHVAGTETLTYYIPHPKRGSIAFDEIGILPYFEGRAVHDGWSSYFNYRCEHGLCNAHHLRELTCAHEQYEQQWAKQMIEFLLEVKQKRENSNGKRFASRTINKFEQGYRRILEMGMEANPPPAVTTGKKKRGRKKKSKVRNLLERLQQYEKATLAFMHDFSVPFDNNPAERDIRMMKVQQKISGTFRSFEGALSFCRIRSYISTAKKQGLNIISCLQDIFSGKKLLPQIF